MSVIGAAGVLALPIDGHSGFTVPEPEQRHAADDLLSDIVRTKVRTDLPGNCQTIS